MQRYDKFNEVLEEAYVLVFARLVIEIFSLRSYELEKQFFHTEIKVYLISLNRNSLLYQDIIIMHI